MVGVVLIVSSNFTFAEKRLNNLTSQQYRVEAAQDHYNAEKSRYDHATDAIEEQTKRVQQQEKRLAAERKSLEKRKAERSAMDAKLAKLKAVLDAEEKQLNIIWDETHR